MRKNIYLPMVLVVSFFIRFQNYNKVFSSIILPVGYDPYYHLRLAEVIVKSGYRPNFDYYINYPYGLKIGWPPLFDYILSIPGILFGFKATEIFAMIFPVILGVLSTLLVYLISKEVLKNEYFAILSALIFAVTPAVVQISVLGFCDYHIWNIFLLLCSIYFLLRNDWTSLLLSIFVTLLTFSWMGAPIYIALIALATLTHFNDKKILTTAMCIGLATVSYVIKPFLGLAILMIVLFLVVGYFVRKIEIHKKYITIYYIILCIFVIFIFYCLPFKELSFVREGINYLLGRNVYLPTIAEAQSFNLVGIIDEIGLFVFFLAIPSILLYELTYKNKFILTLFIATLFLAIIQIRFTTVLAVPVSLYASYTLCILLNRMGYPIFEKEKEESRERKLKNVKKNKKSKNKYKDKQISITDRFFVILFIFFVISTSLIGAIRPFDMSDSWKNALIWINKNTEKTSYYLHPDKKPEYSILSWWDYGNWIVYIAKRPVVCNNFQIGAVDAAKFFTAQSEDEALKIVKKRCVKYVITDNKMRLGNGTVKGKFQAIMRIAGINPETLGLNKTLELYKNSMYYKLHFENAMGLKNFKLLKDFGSVKIFVVRY
ncbi:STT3 domain-containing protein [Archaeoglobus sp.]